MEEMRVHLSGDTRDRIRILMEENRYSQKQLAAEIGITAGAFSRYMSGETESLGDGKLIRLSKLFNVSTDYLLGETNIPDRMNYDLQELGLTVNAARALYTGEIDPKIVSSFIENEHFAKVTSWIAVKKMDDVLNGEDTAELWKQITEEIFDEHVSIHHEDYNNVRKVKRDMELPFRKMSGFEISILENEILETLREVMENDSDGYKNEVLTTKEVLQQFKKQLLKKTRPFNLRKTTKDMVRESVEEAVIQFGVPLITAKTVVRELWNAATAEEIRLRSDAS